MENVTAPAVPRIGVVRETGVDERRVALVPKAAAALRAKGIEVIVAAGAGAGALIPDAAYVEVGATLGDPWSADVVVKVAPPDDAEIANLSTGQGAQWPDLGIDAAGEGGYARELTDDEKATQQKALENAIKAFDVVITTALVPGRPAPRLVTE